MSAVALPSKEKVVEIAEDWQNTPQSTTKYRKREFVQLICRVAHSVSDLASKLSREPFTFTQEKLVEKLDQASEHLDVTSEFLDELENSLAIARKNNDVNSLETLELYYKTVQHLEEKLEELILVGTRAEISYFDEKQKSAFAEITEEEMLEARKILAVINF